MAKIEPLTTARALRGPFDYLRPDGVGIGSMLEVPFAGRTLRGVVTGLAEASEHQLAAPRRVLEHSLPPDLVELALWMAAEFCSTPARALTLVAPPAVPARRRRCGPRRSNRRPTRRAADRSPAGAARRRCARAAARRRRPGGAAPAGGARPRPHRAEDAARHRCTPPSAPAAPAPPLTADQHAAAATIAAARSEPPPEGLLLHGVTGSGKTEVYLRAVGDVLEQGGSAIVLVPEIGLTPQIVSRFIDRFGDTVAVLHSQAPATASATTSGRGCAAGEARIAIGPRSAVFAPVERLGLVIVDEEHDSSYKHEGDPRYDARAVAAQRTRIAGALLARRQRDATAGEHPPLRRQRMAARVDGAPLPAVELVDMRDAPSRAAPATRPRAPRRHEEHRAAEPPRLVELPLLRRLRPRLDVPGLRRLARAAPRRGAARMPPLRPPRARAGALRRLRLGLDRPARDRYRAARARARAARAIEVFRLDADTPRAAVVLAAFEAAPRAVLVGTQMVAKGHDFPDVTLGVVLDADATLRFPDFRAEERTFALVAQLAGPRRPRCPRRWPGARADDRGRCAVAAIRRAPRQRRLRGRRARAARGAALSAVLDPDPDRLLVTRAWPRRTSLRTRCGRGSPCRCSARRRCSGCADASARSCSSRPAIAAPRSPTSTRPSEPAPATVAIARSPSALTSIPSERRAKLGCAGMGDERSELLEAPGNGGPGSGGVDRRRAGAER